MSETKPVSLPTNKIICSFCNACKRCCKSTLAFHRLMFFRKRGGIFLGEAIADTPSSCTMIEKTNSKKKHACKSQKTGESASYLAIIILDFDGLSFQARIRSIQLQFVYNQDARLEIRDLVVRVPLQGQVLQNKHRLISENYKA